MASKTDCPKGSWKVVIGGSRSVRGVYGCYGSKKNAKRAVDRLHAKIRGDPRYGTIWIVIA